MAPGVALAEEAQSEPVPPAEEAVLVDETAGPVVLDAPVVEEVPVAEAPVEEPVVTPEVVVETPTDVPAPAAEEETVADDAAVESAEATIDPAPKDEEVAEATELPAESETEQVEAASDEGPVVADGTYAIGTAAATNKVVDVSGGSKNSGANVQIYNSNKTAAQHWTLRLDAATGLYQLINVGSGHALAAETNDVKAGTNVLVRKENNTRPVQLWQLVGDDVHGYELVSSISDTLCLDLAGGKTDNGTNLRLWTRNQTAAQRFFFYLVTSALSGDAVLEDGCYTISSTEKVLDVKGGATTANSNVQIYSSNATDAQKWYLTYADGYYTISSVASGLVLEAATKTDTPGGNVQLNKAAGTDAQQWRIDTNASGSYILVNKANGFVLDVYGGKQVNGTNVQVYRANGTAAQSWRFTPASLVDEGYVNIYSLLSNALVFDVKGGSKADNALVQLYKGNGTAAQKWQIKRLDSGEYQIKSINSNLYLGVNGTSLVQTSASTSWAAVMTKGGVALVLGDKAVDVPNAQAASGKALQVFSQNGTAAQGVRFKVVPVLADGAYIINSLLSTVLDVKGGSTAKGGNIQTYTKNGSLAQSFIITRNSDGSYVIRNAQSDLVLDVKDGSKANGANVQQWGSNGSDAQKWIITWDDGVFTLTNVKSGKVLAIAGDSASKGANVQQATATGSEGQQWTFTATTVVLMSGDTSLDNWVKKIIKERGWKGESGLRAAYNYIANYGYDLYGTNYMSGDWKKWSVQQAKSTISHRQGNCYGISSVFTWVARGLGYNAKSVAGKVKTTHGWSPHGWTEILVNGVAYVVDTQQHQNDMSHGWNHNFFMVIYDKAPLYYHIGYDI